MGRRKRRCLLASEGMTASVDPWHEPAADPDCESGGRATLPLQVLHAPLHPTGDAAAVITGPGDHLCGHNALSQAFTQFPIPAHRGGYSTGVTDLYQIGAASWPGPAAPRVGPSLEAY
jgi:hypothetical protein